MSSTMKTLGLDRLTVAERLGLVQELWESIAADTASVALTPAQQADLRRRLETHRDDPLAGAPWDEVRERLRGDGS
jgi:putative addiction module component (TIGR02574 family)